MDSCYRNRIVEHFNTLLLLNLCYILFRYLNKSLTKKDATGIELRVKAESFSCNEKSTRKKNIIS